MAKIETVVSLDKKEIDDVVIAAAKAQIPTCPGGLNLQYHYNEDGDLEGAVVTFTGKIKT